MKRKIFNLSSTAQHSTAQHSTAQHSTAQHSTAQHKYKLCKLWERKPLVLVLLFMMNGITLKIFAQADKALQKLDKQFFIENKGQWPSEVLFMTKKGGLNAWITKNGMVYDFYKFKEAIKKAEAKNEIQNPNKRKATPKEQYGQIVRMTLEGANTAPEPKGNEKGEGYINYLIGNEKGKWTTNIEQFKEIIIKNTYNNIDTRYYFDEGNIRYDYIIKPGASPADIKIKLVGSNKININEDGELVFNTRFGDVKQAKLYTYQMIDGRKVTVTCKFKQLANGNVSFDAGSYDKKVPLVVDPVIFSRFIGGSSSEYGLALAVDASGNCYITGNTASSNFPYVTGSYDGVLSGPNDAFITKVDPSGNNYVYSTYIGGSGVENAWSIEVDNTGNAYITGYTESIDFPNSSNVPNMTTSFATSNFGGTDAFITKLNPLGNQLLYSTYIGGSGTDYGKDIALDPAMNGVVYITGGTTSSDFPNSILYPSLPASYDPTYNGVKDIFVVKLNTSGGLLGGLQYSSFIGKSEEDYGNSIAVDALGCAYVTGSTTSLDFTNPNFPFPTLNGSPQNAYVFKLDPSLGIGGLIYFKYIGGDEQDEGLSIAIDASTNVYVAGITQSGTTDTPPFPITIGAFDVTSAGGGGGGLDQDIFFCKIDPLGTTFLYSSYLGGSGYEQFPSIAIDASNQVYISGGTSSFDFPTTDGTPNPQIAWDDVFMTKFRLNGTGINDMAYSKVIDASHEYDFATSNALDCLDNQYIVGYSGEPNYPNPTNNFPITVGVPFSGGGDAILVKYQNCTAFITAGPTGNPISHCTATELYAHTSSGCTTFTYLWQDPGTPSGSLTNPSYGLAQNEGTYTVTVTDGTGCIATATYELSSGPHNLAITSNAANPVCPNYPISLTASCTALYPSVTYAWASGTTPTTGNPVSATPVSNTNYTVVATDDLGCTASKIINIITNTTGYCCSADAYNLYTDPTVIIINNITAANAVFQTLMTYSNSNKTYFVDGIFNINISAPPQSMTFTNCTFYFTPGSSIELSPNTILYLNGCSLSSAPSCDMWKGIIAPNANEQISIVNSTLQNMIEGVSVSNNARINSIDSRYYDNLNSIQLYKNTLAITCEIINNEFKKGGATLLPPYAFEPRPLHGITITDCNNLSIGDVLNVNSGNKFEEVSNGIFIIENGFNSVINPYTKLYYNTFKNIHGNANSLGSQISTSERGCGIYVRNSNSSPHMLKLKGDPLSSVKNFNNCDKGIVLRRSGLEMETSKMDNTVAGVLVFQSAGNYYKILNNSFLNTQLGIYKNGDENLSGFYVANNQFTLSNITPINIFGLVPTAIYSRYGSNTNIGNSTIISNSINIPMDDFGIGVSLNNGSRDNIQDNDIHFGTSAISTAAVALPSLTGIYSNNSIGPLISNNVIDNTSGTNYIQTGNNAAIYINKNIDSRILCNSANYTQYGLFAVGQNGSITDYTRTSGNTMRNRDANWILWQLGLDGTMGQVGINNTVTNFKYDANNTFLGINILNNVFRITSCPASTNDEIVTTTSKLIQTQSTASNLPPNQCYVIIPPNLNNFTQTFNCSVIQNGSTSNVTNMDYNYAMKVANEEIEYDEFTVGAKRADEEMVYAWLEAQGEVMDTDPVLDNFYLSRHSGIIGQLNNIDLELSFLSDSIVIADTIRWNDTLQMAKTHNSLLNTTQVFDANAKWINELYIKTIEQDIEILTSTEITNIETLANTCPYLGGNAVYRARDIVGMYSPGIHYDDLFICNSQGVYKNGISKLQQQLNALEEAKKNHPLAENTILVYPIPTSQNINIAYNLNENEVANFVIYDMLGNEIQRTKLYSKVNKTTMDVHSLARGVYTYKVTTTGYHNYAGKIIIQ